MPDSHSSGSVNATTVLTGPLHIPGYHFKSETTPSLAHGENVDIVYGFRITTRSPIVAKVSTDSLRFEREFYIMRKLYQYKDGSSYIVRPLEYINMPSGLTVAIYADEGQSYLKQDAYDSTPKSSVGGGSDEASTTGSDNSSVNTFRSWVRSRRDRPYDAFDDNGHSSAPTYDLCTFLRFAIKCTDCLEFIHRHGVVHGELKLSAFQWNGSDDSPVKMWNFGSGAKSLETYLTSKGWRKTARNKEYTGMLQNLLVYMSPEQTGRTTYTPDHRTDIYSLGIIYFVLLTGRMPFDGGPLDILNGILSRRVPLIHELQLDVPEILSRIIEKMLHKSPDDRYTSARGIRADLVECLDRLNMAKESSADEVIPPFPLAQHDIASVFTIPKAIYGRQEVLAEMRVIIERSANEHRHSRILSTIEVPMHKRHSRSSDPTDTLSDISETNSSSANNTSHYKVSSNSSNHFDGSDTSSISSRMLGGNSKIGATIVGLYGPAGTGKSTLYSAVQPLARKHGYVAIAKFDSRNKVPYATVLRSLSHALQQILSESEDEINQFYEHLKLCLGGQFNNLTLLTDFVPELKPLSNSAYLVPSNVNESVKMDSFEANKTRFQKVFVEVFRAVSLCRMTTLFLDDLHQADEPSLELIEALIMGRVKMLIFISYRDQEVTTRLSELLENKIANVHFIKTESLTMESLIEFIADTLHRSHDVDYRKELTPFASIVFRKTQGNAFYTTQLLLTLERKKLIYFDWEKNRWDYDIREIEEATIYGSDNESELDVSFMVGRLRELPRAGQSLLKWASFVGDTFSWKMIKALMNQMKQEEEVIARNNHDPAVPALLEDDEDDDDDDEATTLSTKSGSSRRPLQSKRAESSHDSENDPVSGLQAVIQEGYIMSVDDDEFRWCHDRISQAAAELADPEMRDKIHLTIAQYLMQADNIDIFLVADHLLKCHALLMTLDDKERYRQAMIEAGKKGQSSGAHAMAFTYFKSAIKLGDPKEEWSDELYNLTLNLYSNAVGLSWIVGDIEKTEKLLQALFKNTREPIDRVPAYHVQAKYYYALQMHAKGLETLFQCLDELGDERIRVDISDEGLARDSDHVKQLVNELGEDGILKLHPCDDISLKAAVGVMVELLVISYFSDQKKEVFYWSMRILYLSLTKGIMSDTGTACQYAGFGFAYLYQNYKFAESLGRIGISVATKHGNSQDIGRAHLLYTGFTLHFNQHYGDSLSHIRTGMQYSLAAGDRLYAAFHQVHVPIIKFAIGCHISDTIREATAVYDDIHSWAPTIDHNSLAMSIIRTAKALQGQTYIDTPNVFDGDDGFNDEHYMAEASRHSPNNAAIINWHENYKIIPLTLYGHIDAAIESAHRCLETIEGHPLHRNSRMMFFYYSLALLEKARRDPLVRDSCLEQIRANQEQIYDWAKHSSINYMMYWTLIEAELAGFGESLDVLKIGQLYEESINQARKGSWYLEMCVMHEYAGAFYHRIGLTNIAYGTIVKAIELYTCHGAYGKARHLKSKYADMLVDYDDNRHDFHEAAVQTDPVPIIGDSHWSSSSSTSDGKNSLYDNEPSCDTIPHVTTEQALVTLDILDMASILKSSQVMSSEVKFQGLVKSMMNIILENSAADCGAIVIKDEKYGVCAFGSQQQENTTTYDPPRPLSEDDELVSSRIINHTIHTGESVLIHDVEQDTRFTVGPWFERTRSKSVICMPIIHKITTVGCLFIEGPVGIFTQRHITVLSLLCQQMGISITNAFLFKSVQRVTMANMRMIEMQKQALEEARKSKEAADRATRLREIFLANMSHEIRTPFSGFYGMISLLAETSLDPEQRDLVQTAKGSCEMLLQLIDDLLNFSKLRAGKVSLDLSPVVLDDAIADVVEIMIAMAIQKRINITYTIEKDVPAVVITDANRLRQVITNLLGNAIKFTHAGEIIIRCSLDERKRVKTPKSDDKTVPLLIEVIDTGIGITDDQRKVLFVPFSQVDGSTTRRYGGTGLGLSICLQLVELMSGTIEVSSIPGQGSNFHFTIQATRTSEPDDEAREAMVYNLLQSLKQTRILVADKHVSTVIMAQKLLPGIKVDGVCTVAELLCHQATDYPIIIVGLFLTHDPGFEEWSHHLYRFLENAQCIVVMHYPTGAVGELLGENRLTVDINEMSTEPNVNATKSVSGTALSTKSVTVQSNKRRAIVRMAVPLRRVYLLRTLVDMLHQSSSPSETPPTPRPPMPSRYNSGRVTSNKLFTAEERELLCTMHILVAEDNPIAQKLLYKQLTRLGLKVVCANDGLEAVAAWTNHPKDHFKMAFFDHHMPKCDGVEATKRIREIEKKEKRRDHFTIVTLSADIQDCARVKCLNAGMDGYYTKPMNQKTLAEALKRYCLT
ncbi:hypothetical protein BJV82DRAFT_198053 [Fennellomyces sp. T-0311]|nr:hypothetical protein BJV82DRAFT_198053 [Fennellomyces sp. T-0311]